MRREEALEYRRKTPKRPPIPIADMIAKIKSEKPNFSVSAHDIKVERVYGREDECVSGFKEERADKGER